MFHHSNLVTREFFTEIIFSRVEQFGGGGKWKPPRVENFITGKNPTTPPPLKTRFFILDLYFLDIFFL
ncbi:hypothetical protein HanHA300_Chr03g0094451 [Helianthus annuus]|nr:hypothetical protein HanHA300_Chr03g0094451 [Helianthus annuus]KAJ0608221.1 hypothetical protein HanHA89_Chr03g0106171 [Helianthus annuus]KAJ0768285.1 hypothetical protein HanLR1_Chr03g0099531 [Helianthus annuus]